MRSWLVVASALGASGALLLAADMYRRIEAAQSGSQAVSSNFATYFSTLHVLGIGALAFLFLAVFLLLALEKRESASGDRRIEESHNIEAVEVIPIDQPAPPPEPNIAQEAQPSNEGPDSADNEVVPPQNANDDVEKIAKNE